MLDFKVSILYGILPILSPLKYQSTYVLRNKSVQSQLILRHVNKTLNAMNSHPLPFGQWFQECRSEVLVVHQGEAQGCCRALQQGPLKEQEID